MHRVNLAPIDLEDCPDWWFNFVDPLDRGVTNEDLAPHRARFDGESVIFDSEHDFTVFVIKFGGPRCTA